ncbi:hypothetical protein LZ30DRAFT_163289 [Colletotrichum cereale]|nr:hypothetical protein LZ30DRAFT_163289 [Colletotrichum cereale]
MGEADRMYARRQHHFWRSTSTLLQPAISGFIRTRFDDIHLKPAQDDLGLFTHPRSPVSGALIDQGDITERWVRIPLGDPDHSYYGMYSRTHGEPLVSRFDRHSRSLHWPRSTGNALDTATTAVLAIAGQPTHLGCRKFLSDRHMTPASRFVCR